MFQLSKLASRHSKMSIMTRFASSLSVSLGEKSSDISLTFEDGTTSKIYPLWLRDHCHCSDCYHVETEQRLFNTNDVNLNTVPTDMMIKEKSLSVTWPDGHQSSYQIDDLKGLLTSSKPKQHTQHKWDSRISESPPSVAFSDLMKKEEGLDTFLEHMKTYGFAFISDVPVSPEGTQEALEKISPIRETFFGGLWDFSSNLEHADTAYTNIELRSHTDGTYFSSTPGYQAFHCLEKEGTGGNSMLVDGLKVIEILKKKSPEDYEILKTVKIPQQYLDKQRGHEFKTYLPIITEDDAGNITQIRFNNYDRGTLLPNDFEGGFQGMKKFYKAMNSFATILQDTQYEYQFLLQPGTLVVFDNYRVFHGRKSYTGHRRLCGCYLDRDDVSSVMRARKLI